MQERLRAQVLLGPGPEKVEFVAGLDVSYPRDRAKPARAAGVIVCVKDLSIYERVVLEEVVSFPYVPGFLSFRELPPLLSVLERMSCVPDIVLCDGQGVAHPRRFGLACHLGVVTGIPTVGVAKSRLIGTHKQVAEGKGSWQPLQDKEERIGIVLRTRNGVKPVYLSIGHKMDMSSAFKLVLTLCPKYRIPIPIREADRLCSQRSGK